MQQSLQVFKIQELEKVLREKDEEESNHSKNLWFNEVENDIVDLEKAVIKSGKVNKESEAVAYNMISDSLEVYNTAGGKVISNNMPAKVQSKIRKEASGVRSTDINHPGNPDFVCVPRNKEEKVKYIEIKYNGDNLTKNQKEWFNKNKWAEAYILRIEKVLEFDESEILNVEDLVQAEGVKRKNAENLLLEPKEDEE